MFRKVVSLFIILISTICFNLSPVLAYDYIDSSNSENIDDYINEIYLSKQLYEDLAGAKIESETTIYNVSSDMFWWPVGSSETTVSNGKTFAIGTPQTLKINSDYGYRTSPFNNTETTFHSGIDLSNGGFEVGSVNVIASKSGIVVKSSNTCPNSYSCSTCGGGYGNHVIIQHSDGNYTLYAHLHLDSITVKEGESVQQGQVIAKIGSSGCSTGAHLHFEVREGNNAYSSAVNPINYISPENPRPATSEGDSDIIEFIHNHEYVGGPPIVDGKYVVYKDPKGFLTIGWGIYIAANRNAFIQRGIDPKTLVLGAKVDVGIIDGMETEIRENMKSRIDATLSKAGLTLKKNQTDALLSFMYNIGNINHFVESYNEYGDTEKLYENYFSKYVKSEGEVLPGLVNRRYDEWRMFHDGIYK